MTSVYIVEFTTAMPGVTGTSLTPVQRFLVPGVTLPDNSDAYGQLSTSFDGSLVVFAAFAAAVGSAVASSLTGLRAIVAVNQWGFAKTRYVSGPGSPVTSVYAATTCDNSKFYLTTSHGIYSSAFTGQAPVFEGSASLAMYAIACVANASSKVIYGGQSASAGRLSSRAYASTGTLGNGATIASGSLNNLRGFVVTGYDASFKERVWTADLYSGVSFNWFAGGLFTQSAPNQPAGKNVIGVISLGGTTIWVSTASGVYALDSSTAGCTSTSNTPCAWLNSAAPVLLPSISGSRSGAFAGLAKVPTSADTPTPPRPFTSGNFLAVRVGNGVAALSSTASSAPVYLEEYQPNGKLVQAVLLSGGLIPNSQPFKLMGTGMSSSVVEGLPSLSNNNYFVSLAAYAGAPLWTGVVAIVTNAGSVDFSTRFTPASNFLQGISSAAVSNAADIAWACRTIRGVTSLGAMSVSYAGNASDLTTGAGALPAGCTYSTFAGNGGAANVMWVGRAKNISTATVAAPPSSLAKTKFSVATGLTNFSSVRQFDFRSPTEMYVADYGLGVWQMLLDGSAWTNSTLLRPCATFSTVCMSFDLGVIGVAVVPSDASTLVYVSTSTCLYAVDITDAMLTVPLNNFLPIVPARTNMELRGLVLAPIAPPGGVLVYPAATSFTSGNLLALRAETAGTTTSRLYVDEINPQSASVVQSWLLPYTGAGNRATLPGVPGAAGRLTVTADGQYVTLPAYDTEAGFTTPTDGGTYGHTIATISCRGTVALSPAQALADTWFGSAADTTGASATTFIASSAGLLTIDTSSGAITPVNTSCVDGFAAARVLGPASAPTTYALSSGCGMYKTDGVSSTGFAVDSVATLSVSRATSSFAVVPLRNASTPVEYFYAAPDGSLAQSAFVSGSTSSSRGSVSPVSGGTDVIAGVYGDSFMSSNGLYVATTSAVWACLPLACGPGAATFALSVAGLFRTSPGAGYANNMTCTISVSIPGNYYAGASFLLFKTTVGDAMSVKAGGSTLLRAYSGTTLPNSVVATTNSLSVTFNSSAAGATAAGVIGKITALPWTCGTTSSYAMTSTALLSTLASGSLLKTQAGSTYAIKQRCDFLATASSGNAVTLELTQFAVLTGSILTIYDGSTPQSNILGRVYSTTLSMSVSAQATGIMVGTHTFVTDDAFSFVSLGTTMTGPTVGTTYYVLGTGETVLTVQGATVGGVFTTPVHGLSSGNKIAFTLGASTSFLGCATLSTANLLSRYVYACAVTATTFRISAVSTCASQCTFSTATVGGLRVLPLTGGTAAFVFGTASASTSMRTVTVSSTAVQATVSAPLRSFQTTSGTSMYVTFYSSETTSAAGVVATVSASTYTAPSNAGIVACPAPADGVSSTDLITRSGTIWMSNGQAAPLALAMTSGIGTTGVVVTAAPHSFSVNDGLTFYSFSGITLSSGATVTYPCSATGACSTTGPRFFILGTGDLPVPIASVSGQTLTTTSAHGMSPGNSILFQAGVNALPTISVCGLVSTTTMRTTIVYVCTTPSDTQFTVATASVCTTICSWAGGAFTGPLTTRMAVLPLNGGTASFVFAATAGATTVFTLAVPGAGTGNVVGVYPVSYACSGSFQAPTGYNVKLFVNYFGSESTYDVLNVYDGSSTQSALLQTGVTYFNAVLQTNTCPSPKSGINYQGSYCISSGQYVTVRFMSDNSYVNTGVVATATFQYLPTSLATPMLCVSGSPTTIGGTSGGWTAGTQHWFSTTSKANMACTLVFTAPPGYVVSLNIHSWATRVTDVFSVVDGPSATLGSYPQIITPTSVQPTGTLYSTGNSMTVSFTAGLSPLAGITAYATPVLLSSVVSNTLLCTRMISSASRALSAGGSVFLRTNPGNLYGNNMGCAFLLTAPANQVVTLSFISFVTESAKDLFSVFDGTTPQDTLLGSFSGSVVPANVTSTGANMHVTFTSSASNAYTGVVAIAQAATPGFIACVSGSSATIAVTTATQLRTSATGTYPSGLSCSFRVMAPTRSSVVISYTSFSVNAGDAWSVYDGTTELDPLLNVGTTTGSTAPNTISSTGTSLYITFKSVAAGGAGVVATVQFIAASACSQLASATVGSAFLGITAAPSDCGANGGRRRLRDEEDTDVGREVGPLLESPTHVRGSPPGTAPCHASQDRDACLVPTREIKTVKAHRRQ